METPQFNSDEEYLSWALERISEAITNLTKRLEQVETGLQKIPPPGPDMIKYKPTGSPTYINFKEILDILFDSINAIDTRLNNIEEKIDL